MLESKLLKSILPYQWLFTFFTLSPPPVLYYHLTIWQFVAVRIIFTFYSIIVLGVAFWSMYFNCHYMKVTVEKFDLDTITLVLGISRYVSVWLVTLIIQYKAFFGYKEQYQLFRKIADLEKSIAWEDYGLDSEQLPTSKRFRLQLFFRSGLLFAGIVFFMSAIFYVITGNHLDTVWKRSINVYFTLLIQIKYVEYCVLVQTIHILLGCLCEQLENCRRNISLNEHGILRSVFYVGLQSNKQHMAQLWDLVRSLEDYFSYPMLALFLNNGITIVHISNWAYSLSVRDDDCCRIYRLGSSSSIIVNMLIPCWISQMAINQYKKISATLHNIRNQGSDEVLSNLVREYSLQLCHQPLRFSCGGFFDINLKYFGLMLLSVTTYVVILIQFKLQAETEKENFHKMESDW